MKGKTARKYDILAVYSLEDASGREHFSGVLKYLSGKNDWRLHVREPGNGFTADDVNGRNGTVYDGIIVSLPGTDAAMRLLTKSKIPTVLVNIDDPGLLSRKENISFVWLDNAEIGRTGARHLLSLRRFAEFGFVPDPNGMFFNRERASAFRDTLQTAGKHCRCYTHSPIDDRDAKLAGWLKGLEKPAAVMTANAITASRVLKLCQALKLRIPEDIALIGVGADTFLSEESRPTISSILPNFVEMGYRAAKELDKLISAKKHCKFREVVLSAMEISSRESTRFLGQAEGLVLRAETYVNDHAADDIRATDVLKFLGCSRRLAELRFSQLRNHSVRFAIETARLKLAEKQLARTNKSVKEIARDLHFRSPNALSRIFKRHYGMTIGAWQALRQR